MSEVYWKRFEAVFLYSHSKRLTNVS